MWGTHPHRGQFGLAHELGSALGQISTPHGCRRYNFPSSNKIVIPTGAEGPAVFFSSHADSKPPPANIIGISDNHYRHFGSSNRNRHTHLRGARFTLNASAGRTSPRTLTLSHRALGRITRRCVI
jgi:hypothetical protein